MDGCVFCAIVAGREPASRVYEDDRALAVLTIGPVNRGHALVLPRRHAADLADLDEDEGAHLFRVAMRVAAAIRRSGVRCEGVNLFLADGAAAFQEVFHVHLHVFPRFRGDAFRLEADWSVRPDRAELAETAALLRAAL
jgi:histidine triad (HIT) family protein